MILFSFVIPSEHQRKAVLHAEDCFLFMPS
uniref:Uncharacterized protein n=1 Tax=Caudovirales sp. ctNZz8 TaxID=2826772 RepID=A0A8S5QZG2_9CAUD|nr:MAG TPA: hypothetical protein [Caudovirales sp. ctNZz8]